MKEIKFNNEIFILDISGIIIWPKRKIAVVADLHLEKASFLASKGNFFPPYDSLETLLCLKSKLKQAEIKKVIFLGDIFHDNNGYERLRDKTKKIFDEIITKYEIVFITGNHDRHISIPNIRVVEGYTTERISFSHYPLKGKKIEIFGHFHPKFVIKTKRGHMSKKCFVIDQDKILLPAFGKFTGGVDVSEKIFYKIFSHDCTYYLLGKKKILEIKKN